MKIVFNLITSLVLAYWPILMMTSVMFFDAPGSTDKKQPIIGALIVTFIPVIFGLLYYATNAKFWGIAPKTFLISTVIVSILVALLFGYPKLMINNIKGVSSNGYFVKDGKVFYEGDLIEASSNKFAVLDQFHMYAADEKTVFFRGRPIAGANATLFTVIQGSNYYTDGNSIYFEGKVLEGADAATFTQLKIGDQPTSYFKDKNTVYSFGKKIEGIKAASVKVLDEVYLVDADSAFYYGKKIAGADAATFAAIPDQESFAKDKTAIYYKDVAYPHIDAASLEILDRGYLKDKSKVYHRSEGKINEVIGANPANFRVTNWDAKTESEATDGAHYYSEGKAK